jgi:hypothetical protein
MACPSAQTAAQARGARPEECLAIQTASIARGRRTCSRRTRAGASITQREEAGSGTEPTPAFLLERDGNLTPKLSCKRA